MSESTAISLSEAQSAAVADRRPQVLVAAAAGSGKTRLLVATVVRALVEEQLPMERLVAVTFTRKAGAELALRVRDALEELGRADLAGALDGAVLGTIDSLCRRMVKDRALEVGVDPNCAVLEAEAAELVKADVIDKAWESVVERADAVGLRVLAAQGKGFRGEVVGLYDRLRGLGYEEPRIDISGSLSEDQAREKLERTVGDALAAGSAHAKQTASLAGDLDKLRECLEWIAGPAQTREGEAGLRSSGRFFPSRRTRSLEEDFGRVRSALTEYRCALAESLLRPVADTVNALLAEFHQRYTSFKSERGLLDFSDLELKARSLLAQDPTGGPDLRVQGDVASGGLMRGAFVLVDEFQDTNQLQYDILSRLGADRMLMVGDDRQSIYRFRGADVDVFRRRQEALRSEEGSTPTGGLHRLDVNYRSSSPILDFINRLFSHADLFGEEFVCLAPDHGRAPLRPAGQRDAADAAVGSAACPVQVLVATRWPAEGGKERLVSMRQAEAEALAGQVRSLLDDEGWQQRDIVVLLPTQTEVGLYREALLNRGVDVYVVRGKGYYSQEEVSDVINLLRVTVAPHDDLALLSVLRSPMVDLSDDALYLLGKEGRRRHVASLWEVVRGGRVESLPIIDAEALEVFKGRMEQVRSRVGRPGLAGLIDDAVSLFAYDLCVLGTSEGRLRFANIRKLMRLADEFESVNGPDLTGFLSVVRSVEQVSDREGSAPTLGESEDVVRIMTVHQAKGLEFPVVVLAGLGADVHRPEVTMFAVGSDGRMGMFLRGHRNDTYEDHDPCWGPAVEIAVDDARREREEDVRLLYVAMTRAQERLMLVGARPTRGEMSGSRIGRIVGALGLAALPDDGETVCVDGLAVSVRGVVPPGLECTEGLPWQGDGSPDGVVPIPAHEIGADDGDQRSVDPPAFLELPKAVSIPDRVSYSVLAAYQRCPRQFYLQRVLGLTFGDVDFEEAQWTADLPSDHLLDPAETHMGRDVGVVVHRVLEKSGIGSVRPTEERIRESVMEALVSLGMSLSTSECERATRLVLAAWEWPGADTIASQCAESEAAFLFTQDGVVVSGVMDVVCKEAERWHVIDYKTNALRGRSVAEVADSYRLQCVVYGLAALRAGAPAVEMELVFLEHPTAPFVVRYGVDDMPGLEKELLQALVGLRRGVFPRRVGEDCPRCPVADVCRSMVAD